MASQVLLLFITLLLLAGDAALEGLFKLSFWKSLEKSPKRSFVTNEVAFVVEKKWSCYLNLEQTYLGVVSNCTYWPGLLAMFSSRVWDSMLVANAAVALPLLVELGNG